MFFDYFPDNTIVGDPLIVDYTLPDYDVFGNYSFQNNFVLSSATKSTENNNLLTYSAIGLSVLALGFIVVSVSKRKKE